MEEIAFQVQGSAAEPYTVRFVLRAAHDLSAYCSCPAGEIGQYCKHRFEILAGGRAGIVSPNADDVKIVQGWLPGTDVEAALFAVQRLEMEAARIKKELFAAKKAVAKAMAD